MRKVTFGINVSVDGCCDHRFFQPDEEVHAYFTSLMNGVDLLFFGRVMYELMFPYWAEVANSATASASDRDFGRAITRIPKIVVSKTLDAADDVLRIVREDPVGELSKLKQGEGGTISVDSLSMLPGFLEAGLIDELNVVVHPVFVGRGRRLFDPDVLAGNQNLRLLGTHVFTSGCIALRYQKV